MNRRTLARHATLVVFGVMLVPMAGLYWVGDFDEGSASTAQRLRQGEIGQGAPGPTVERLQQEVRRKLAITWGISLLALGAGVAYLRRAVLRCDTPAQ